MQAIKRKNAMNRKRISISSKRQITIPVEYYQQLGMERELECYINNGTLVLRPVAHEYSGEFAEQILSDLISKGYQGEELMRRFKSMNRAMRPAVESMLSEVSSLDPSALPGMDDVFPTEEE